MAKVFNGVVEDATIKMEEVQLVREKLSFHQAARYGNVPILQKYLQKFHGRRKKINKLDKQEFTALHYAVRYGHFEVIQILLSDRANVNAVGSDGAQPIHIAAKFFKSEKHKKDSDDGITSASMVKQVLPGIDNSLCALIDANENVQDISDDEAGKLHDVITYLLRHGADVNAVDAYDQSPLHYAACKGNVDAMKLLLDWPGIDVDMKDTAGGTPLHSACANGQVDAVRMLLRAGAELMVWDNEHQNPFHHAASSDEGAAILSEMIYFVEQKGGVIENWALGDILNDQDNQGESVLHIGVDLGHFEVCRVVLEKGARVNLCRANFATSLHLAATTGDLEIAELLVSHGADLEAQNIEQETPLHKAAGHNRIKVIKYLLQKGCNIDVDDQDNTTPLIMAAYNGSKEAVQTVQVLLDHNADMSALDSAERSAIYWAAHENAYDVLKILLEKLEQNPKLKHLIEQTDRFENTPLHIAAKKGFRHVLELLIEHNADVDCCNDEDLTPLHLAAINGNRKVITTLLTKQPNIINDEDESGNTALHLSALNGHAKIMDVLIDFGAGVDPRNNLLWTPLDCAAAKGHNDCVARLLDRDAPIDPMDLAKTTPLHLASREGHADVVRTLLDNGADVTLVNHEGMNALNMAVENTHREVALVILDHKDWLLAVKNRLFEGKTITTPMRQLIKKLPDVALVLLNKCMKLSTNLPHDSEDFEVRFYYDLIDDTYADWSNDYEEGETQSIATGISDSSSQSDYGANKLTIPIRDLMEKKENHPLMIMCENRSDKLLSHPLCLSLMYLKWQMFGRVVFYSKFLLYFIFIFFFTGFILISTPLLPRMKTVGNNQTCEVRATKADKERINVMVFFVAGRMIVLILGFLQLILEVPQLISRRLIYILDLTNILEWIIYILAIIYAWPEFDQMLSPGLNCNAHVSVGAIAIFSAWINLLLFIRKFPTLGIYVVMFVDVTKTFLKFSITFILFVVSFALGFYTLLEDKFPLVYDNIGRTVVKTLVMMIGEFDFDDLFNGGEVHPPAVTWLLFIIFVIIMTILLMNLMVGLAVDDIKGVLDEAALTRISMQLNLVVDVEKSLPRSLRMRYITKNMIVYPNREFKWYKKALMSHITRMSEIEEALRPKKTVSDIIQEHTQSIHESVEKLKVNSKLLTKQMKNMEHMLEKLLLASNVIDDDDDEDNN